MSKAMLYFLCLKSAFKIRNALNINLEDPRIFYHNNYYYIIAVDSSTIKDNILPKLIKLDSKLNIINIQHQFMMLK